MANSTVSLSYLLYFDIAYTLKPSFERFRIRTILASIIMLWSFLIY